MHKLILIMFFSFVAYAEEVKNFRIAQKHSDGTITRGAWMEEDTARSLLRIGCFVNAENEWIEVKKKSFWRRERVVKEPPYKCPTKK